MKSLFKISLVFCLAVLSAQAQVQISVALTPPYPVQLTDLVSRQNQLLITVINTNPSVLNVKFKGSVTGDNGVRVTSNSFSNSVEFQPFESKQLNASQIRDLFALSQMTLEGITMASLIQLGGLPEGSYQVCVRAFDVNGQPISPEAPSGCSNSFYISQLEPPIILQPADGGTVANLGQQNVLFTWTTPAGSPPNTAYIVKLYEMLDTTQPAQTAINSNNAIFMYEQEVMGSNVLLYGPAMPTLTPGRRYALLIQAIDRNQSVVFRNNGLSEAISFKYALPPNFPVGGAPDSISKSRPGIPLPSDAKAIAGNVRIEGSIEWGYATNDLNPMAAKPLVDSKRLETIPFQPYDSKSLPGDTSLGTTSKMKAAVAKIYGIQKGGGASAPPTLLGEATTDAQGKYSMEIAFEKFDFYDQIKIVPDYKAYPGAFIPTGFKIYDSQSNPLQRLDSITAVAKVETAYLRMEPAYFHARIVCEKCGPDSPYSAQILMKEVEFNNHPFLKDMKVDDKSISYNNTRYVAVAQMTDNGELRKLPPNKGSNDHYLTQLFYGDNLIVSYPFSMTQSRGKVLNYYPQISLSLSGTLSYQGKIRPNVRIRVAIPAKDLLYPISDDSLVMETTTDNIGFYQLDKIPLLKSGAELNLEITDRSIRPQPWSEKISVKKNETSIVYDINLKSEHWAVLGRLEDQNGRPVKNAQIRDNSGNFVTTSEAGIYLIEVEANQYSQSGIKLMATANGYNSANLNIGAEKEITSLSKTITAPDEDKDFANLINNTNVIKAANVGGSQQVFVTGPDNFYQSAFGTGKRELTKIVVARTSVITAKDPMVVFKSTLNGAPAKGNLRIKDKTGKVLKEISTADGSAEFSASAGNYSFTLSPMDGNPVFMPFTGNFSLKNANVDTIKLLLEEGVEFSGKVSEKNGGNKIDSALIKAIGLSFESLSASDGTFKMIVPKGREITYQVSREAYASDTVVANATQNFSRNIQLSLLDQGLPKIKSLSGYPVSLDSIYKVGQNLMISGKLKLKSNDAFSVEEDNDELTFSDVAIVMEDGNDTNALPTDDVYFEESTLEVKALGFAPVEVSGSPGLKLQNLNNDPDGDYSVAVIGGDELKLLMGKVSNVATLPLDLPDAVLKDTTEADEDEGADFNYVFITPGSKINALSEEKKFEVEFEDDISLADARAALKPANSGTPGAPAKPTPTPPGDGGDEDEDEYIVSDAGLGLTIHVKKEGNELSGDGLGLEGFMKLPKMPGVSIPDSGKVEIEELSLKGEESFGLDKLVLSVGDTNALILNLQKFEARVSKLIIIGELGTPNFGLGLGGEIHTMAKDNTAKSAPTDSSGAKNGIFYIDELSIARSAEDGFTLAGKLRLPEEGFSVQSLIFSTPEESSIEMSYSSGKGSFEFSASGLVEYDSTAAKTSPIISSVFPIKIRSFKLNSKDWSIFLAAEANLEADLGVLTIQISKFLLNIGYDMSMDKMNSFLVADDETPLGEDPSVVTPDNANEMMDESKATWAVGIAGGVTFPSAVKGMNNKDSTKTGISTSLLLASTSDGIKFRLNEIEIALKQPAFTMEAKLKLEASDEKTGFEAECKVETLTKKLNGKLKFYYYNSGGIELGAEIQADVSIPTGPVMWFTIGGGFDLNTVENKYMFKLMGDIGANGTVKDAAYVSAEVQVLFDVNRCGAKPIIDVKGSLYIKKEKWGQATAKADFCKSLLLITVNAEVPLAKDVLTAKVDGVLFGIAAGSNSCMFLGVNAQLDVAGIVEGYGFIAVGVNYKNSLPDVPGVVKGYYNKINPLALDEQSVYGPEEVRYQKISLGHGSLKIPYTYRPIISQGTSFNGVYLKGGIEVPRKTGRVAGPSLAGFKSFELNYDFYGNAETEIYFKYPAQVGSSPVFSAKIDISAHASASATIMGASLNGKADAEVHLAGGYDKVSHQGWYANGNASLGLQLYNSNSAGCNSISSKWNSCCCFGIPYICGWSCCSPDWCTKRVCGGYPSFAFKVCTDLKASFKYEQGDRSPDVNISL